jgi:Rha family phage regulatory protein
LVTGNEKLEFSGASSKLPLNNNLPKDNIMELIINNVEVNLIEHDGAVFANSIEIAEVFEKQHKDVIRKIDRFGTRAKRNFTPVTYSDTKGEDRPSFNMNRDGFMFLVMGFTGSKAENWKLDFIDAFNFMEHELRSRQQMPKPEKVKPLEMFKMVLATMEDQEARLTRLENTSTIDSAQQAKIQTEVGRRVHKIIEAHNLSRGDSHKLFSRVYKMLKSYYQVGSYKDIPKIKYDEAINLIRNAPFGGML